MGTRCLTVFNGNEVDGESSEEIAVMYRQFDGYLDCHGRAIVQLLKNKKLVNGLSGDRRRAINGGGCLAASVVAHFKEEAGNIYLERAGTRDVGERWVYTLTPKYQTNPKSPFAHDGFIHLKIEARNVEGGLIVVFDGDIRDCKIAAVKKQYDKLLAESEAKTIV